MFELWVGVRKTDKKQYFGEFATNNIDNDILHPKKCVEKNSKMCL